MPLAEPHGSFWTADEKEPHPPQYDQRAQEWQRCRDCVAGASRIKAAGTTYLPRLSKEQSEESYSAYLAQAIYVNAPARTIGAMTGLVSRVPPRVTAPADLDTQNVTGDGEGLPLFGSEALRETLTTGRIGIGLDAIDGRIRWRRYPAEAIKTWQTIPGYRDRLSMVMLREFYHAPVPDHEFQMSEYGRLVIWRMTDDGATVVTVPEDASTIPAGTLATTARGEPLQEIPVVIVGVGDVRAEPAKPPLLDLCDVAIQRYVASAQYQRGLFWGAVPQPYVISDEALPDLTIGGGSVWRVPVGGGAGMVESSGAGLASMQANLDDLTKRSADLGAQLITNVRQAPETAEAARIQAAGDAATLAGIAGALDTGIERAMRLHAAWAGLSGDVGYKSNQEYFDPRIDAAELTGLLAAYQAGALTLRTLLERLQAGGTLPPDVDIEQEREAIARERNANGIESTAESGGVR